MSQYDELAARLAVLEARDRMQRAILSMVTDPATWQSLLDFHAEWKDELQAIGKVLNAFFDTENVPEQLIDTIVDGVKGHVAVHETWLEHHREAGHLSH